MATGLTNHRGKAVITKLVLLGLLGWSILSVSPARPIRANGQKTEPIVTAKTNVTAAREATSQAVTTQPARPKQKQAEAFRPEALNGAPTGCQLFADFESGGQDFTVVSIAGTQLWHRANGVCGEQIPAGHSPPTTFYYGQDNPACNYDTGARNASNLISPNISVETLPLYILRFNYLLSVDSSSSSDKAQVDVSIDDGMNWQTLLTKADLINDNQWHTASVDATPQVGSTDQLKLRFQFDSVDNQSNSSTGWQIDDVLVCSDAPGGPWTTAGAVATVDEDSTAIAAFSNFAAGLAPGLTGSVHLRYNITAVDGIKAYCPATLSVVKVRFRNSDNTGTIAQVRFDIHTSSVWTGGNTVIFSFSSHGNGNNNAFTSVAFRPAIDFDFAHNIYWIEATIFKSVPSAFADLGSIQIWEANGTACRP
jgi:hypothetical protein